MTASYQIDDNIPIPQVNRNSPKTPGTPGLTAALLSMEIGQSIYFAGVSTARMGGRLKYAMRTGRRFIAREWETGCRVWRTA